MILMLWVLLEITLLLGVCPKIYMIIFGSSYLCVRHQVALGSQAKESPVAGHGLEIPLCFIFQVHVKGIVWVKKKIKDAEKMVQSCIEK